MDLTQNLAPLVVLCGHGTRSVNLDARTFLHFYDWKADESGRFLTAILTAPMVVTQRINSQYLFSTLDNTAYGGGSKATENITGKLGVMQGNASYLMHGLPLQSHLRDPHLLQSYIVVAGRRNAKNFSIGRDHEPHNHTPSVA